MKRNVLGAVGVLFLAGWAGVLRAEERATSDTLPPPAQETKTVVPTPSADAGPTVTPVLDAAPVNDHGDHGGQRGHFVGGLGLYLVQPVFNNNPAFARITTNGGFTTNGQQDFRWSVQAAPMAWAGYVGESGFGARVRWWQFHQSSATDAPVVGANQEIQGASIAVDAGVDSKFPGDTFLFHSNLSISVWDFELTQEIKASRWDLTLAGGVRYAHMSQHFDALQFDAIHDLLAESIHRHSFNGAGPTFALDARRPLGESGFAVYANARGALLFGTHQYNSLGAAGGDPPQIIVSNRHEFDVVPIGEMEVGAEYSRNFGRARLLVQGGFHGQIWWGAGNASAAGGVDTFDSSNANFGFVGVALRTGISY